jgi:hypothetical protein
MEKRHSLEGMAHREVSGAALAAGVAHRIFDSKTGG